MEGQTHVGMQETVKMSLAVMNLTNKVALHSNANTTSAHAPQVEIKYGYCVQKQLMEKS